MALVTRWARSPFPFASIFTFIFAFVVVPIWNLDGILHMFIPLFTSINSNIC
jgi:hypothetical protein